jgi:hypothetical protein
MVVGIEMDAVGASRDHARGVQEMAAVSRGNRPEMLGESAGGVFLAGELQAFHGRGRAELVWCDHQDLGRPSLAAAAAALREIDQAAHGNRHLCYPLPGLRILPPGDRIAKAHHGFHLGRAVWW